MGNETKTCHFCGEEILTVAIKCRHCGSMLNGSPVSPAASEEILADAGANLFRGVEGVGGRLKITNRRVLFEPHVFNLQTSPADIAMTDIAEVCPRDTWGFIPNGILIRTRAGVEYKLVVWGRDKLIGLIQDRLGELNGRGDR